MRGRNPKEIITVKMFLLSNPIYFFSKCNAPWNQESARNTKWSLYNKATILLKRLLAVCRNSVRKLKGRVEVGHKVPNLCQTCWTCADPQCFHIQWRILQTNGRSRHEQQDGPQLCVFICRLYRGTNRTAEHRLCTPTPQALHRRCTWSCLL